MQNFEILMEKQRKFEDLIYELNEDNIDEAAKVYFEMQKFPEKTLLLLFHHVLSVRPLLKEKLAHLWQKILPDYDPEYNSKFVTYLRENNFIKSTKESTVAANFSQDKFSDPSTIEYAIACDDVNSVSRIIEEKGTIPTIPLLLKECTLLDIAAYCGSLSVFKFLQLKDIKVTTETAECAIMGGNENIIEYVSEHINYEDALIYAIRYHHNHLLEWICSNDHVTAQEIIEISHDNFNTGAVQFALEKYGPRGVTSDHESDDSSKWVDVFLENFIRRKNQ